MISIMNIKIGVCVDINIVMIGWQEKQGKVWPAKAKTKTFCLFHFAVIGLILAYTLPTSFKYWVTTYTSIIYLYHFLKILA